MRVLLIIVLGLFLIAPLTVAETVQPAVPVDRPAPEYPLLPDDLEGFVKLHFTIGKDGRVKDAKPFESSPPGVFDDAAIAALSQWSYRPKTVDGVPVEQPDNGIILRFKPSADQPAALLNKRPPSYPREAFDAKLEGKVTVGYDIDQGGMTKNIKVIEGSGSSILDKEAVSNVSDRVFRPMRVNGAPQSLTGLTTVVDFKLSEAVVKPKLVHQVTPVYPKKAEDDHLNGICDVVISVEPDGSVSNAIVTLSYPRGVFDQASLKAVKSWRFEPAETPNGPVARKTYFLFKYILYGGPSWGATEKELHYLKPGQWVKLDYTLQADGSVADVAIIGTSDPSVHTDQAVEQLRKTKYAPHLVNGQPVVMPHQTATIVGPQE